MLEINYRDSFWFVLLLYEGSEEIGGESKRESSYSYHVSFLQRRHLLKKRIGTFLLYIKIKGDL